MNVWRDRMQRLLAPMARRSPLSPNAITIIALLLSLGGAGCLYAARLHPRLFLAGLVLVGVGGMADALDGIVAREQGKGSRYGDFLDHTCDRVSDALVATGWALGSGVRVEMVVLVLFLVMFSGYLGTQIEATFGERNYDSLGRGEFVLGLVVFPLVSYIVATNGWSALRFGSLTIAEWLAALLLVFAVGGVIQRFRLASRF